MRILVALGGNALLRRSERPDAAIQRRHVADAARSLAKLATEHTLVICHGNGPQIGVLASESESDPALSAPYGLDVLGAQTQGMIGYWLVQELANAGVVGELAALVTQTEVSPSDPAMSSPSKFIGPSHDARSADALRAERGWDFALDGQVLRRVVPSPDPVGVVELESIRRLVTQGATVICGGGGGVPVVRTADGTLAGVPAVVDKDLTASLLSVALDADRFLVLTDVAAVMSDFGGPHEKAITVIDVAEVNALRLPRGSMGPKVEACARFVHATGRRASIGALEESGAVLAGDAGTTLIPSCGSDLDGFGAAGLGADHA